MSDLADKIREQADELNQCLQIILTNVGNIEASYNDAYPTERAATLECIENIEEAVKRASKVTWGSREVVLGLVAGESLLEQDVYDAAAQFSFSDSELKSALKLVCKRTQWSEETPSAYVMGWAKEIAQLVTTEKKEAIMDAWKLAADQIKAADANKLRAPIGDLLAFHEREAKGHVSSQWIYSNHMFAVQAYKKVLRMIDEIRAAAERQVKRGGET